MTALRCITYLAPSLPLELFVTLTDVLRARLGIRVELESDRSRSGPLADGTDPFTRGAVDLGFVCTPSYLWLSALEPSPVALLPAALVSDDPRCAGRPVFFSDLVVRADHPATSLADLEGSAWAYNDRSSISGYFNVLRRLDELGAGPGFFREVQFAGSHLEAMARVAAGDADMASIDSNVLRLHPGAARGLRVLESLGPHPIQPILVRSSLPADLQQGIAAALLGLRDELRPLGFRGVCPVTARDYDPERQAFASSPSLCA